MTTTNKLWYSWCCVFAMGWGWRGIFEDWLGWSGDLGLAIGMVLGVYLAYSDLWRKA